MGIEKIGLPAKPAGKGSSWAVDGSSCQSCQAPFTLFNRKHHCRRCGGLFCGTCSNSKVILRGQGDSSVRVCEPCKQLEEAARFQLRQRGKQNKGALTGSSVAEDEALLKDVLGDHGLESLVSGGSELFGNEDDGDHGTPEVSPSKDKVLDPREENTSPERLRDQALEQKRVYATLKREGRNAEALQAFKRHKELTRQADALELSLKKAVISQRKALAEGIASTDGSIQSPDGESPVGAKDAGRPTSTAPEKVSSRDSATGRKASSNGADDDLLNALKDLGWKEADLSEKKVKKGPTSDMVLLAEISGSLPNEANTKKPAKQNPTQLEILGHKRQALALKREGKPAEAKEELRKAKMLERKLEEMALLEDEDEDEDDDDELAALMRSLNKEAKMGTGKDPSFLPAGGDIPPLSFSLAEEDDDDPNMDVTDDDINDPSIMEALRSMGWEEEAATMERARDPQTAGPEAFHIAESVNKESSLQSEILTHKRRALALKREGKVSEAKIELQEAKVLEQKLEALKSQPMHAQPISSAAAASGKLRGGPPKGRGGMRLEDDLEDIDDEVEVDEDDMRDPEMMAALKAMGFEEEDSLPPLQTVVKPSPLEKKNLQDEILSVKRSALALKKQGKTEQARDELRQAKILEQKLEKMQKDLEANALPPVTAMATKSQRGSQIPLPALIAAGVVSEDEEEDVEVSADDFMDPDLVAALKSVGWQEEDTFVADKGPEKEEDPPVPVQQPYKAVKLTPKDHARKSHLQKELLAHKRRALVLKREGKAQEAKLELAKGKALEKEMEEIDSAAMNAGKEPQLEQATPVVPNPLGDESDENEDVTDEDMHDPALLNDLKAFGWKSEPEKTSVPKAPESPLPAPAKVEKAKLDVAHPPYTKAVAESEPAVDPIWHAIMKSASTGQNQVPDMVMEQTTRGHIILGDHSFERDHGEIIGSSTDWLPPLFDHPSSVPDPPKAVPGQVFSLDLLSGGAWDAVPAENVSQKADSKDDDSVFDSGSLAALQSIGLGPPSTWSSSVQLQRDAANVTRQNYNQQIEQTQSAEFRRGQENISVPDRTTSAEPVESSATGRPGRVGGEVGRVPVSPQPAESISRDHVAAGPSLNNGTSAADTCGGIPSLQEEIKMHKRKALALKRDGKNSEALEELRQAKILAKQLEMGTQLSTEERLSKSGGEGLSASGPQKPSQTLSPEQSSQATPSHHAQTHKEQVRQEMSQGKDRKKLQQESLAHKRMALGLRREGNIDEADAEFELAKTLEKQMEDLDQQMGKALAEEGTGMVEDVLDPQLMAALKGVGFNDGDLHGGANVNRVSAGPPSINRSNQQPHPQAGQGFTNGPPNRTNVQQKNIIESSNESQSREGRSTSAASPANRVEEERIPKRTSQPIQLTGGKSKEEERVGFQRQQVDPAPEGGRVSMGAGSSSANTSQLRRKLLEDKIKREKVKAVELKRAGRQGEALEILRGAKRLERDLQAMAS